MRVLETVFCHLHLCYQPRYPHFTLCRQCYAEAPHESKVVEAVVNYFSKPQFQEFFIETEHEIQMGSTPCRADIVLLDKQEHFIAIAECKRKGYVNNGIAQLKSYLCATDTQFGVFANSKNPNEWEFYENLSRNKFTPPMEHYLLQTKVISERTIESIREEKERLDREITEIGPQLDRKDGEIKSSSEQLDDLKQKVKQAKNQLVDIKRKIIPLREKSTDLTEKITRDSQQSKVIEGLKLESTHDRLKEDTHSLSTKRDQLRNEIGAKEQQYTCLSQEVNLLEKNRDELKRRENKIKSEQETLQREKEIWRNDQDERENWNDYLEQRNDKLQKNIKHKTSAISDINRLSKLEELEAAFNQESIYGQIRKELERLGELESKIKSKQQLAQQVQERRDAYKRNKVKTNQKIQQLAQVSQEKESILKQLRVVVNQLKTSNSEQKLQIEENRRQLVEDLRDRKKSICKFIGEINKLKEVKSELEEEIRQEGHQLPLEEREVRPTLEEREVRPTYVQIQSEIDKLKAEKSKIEAKIGHQIFLRLP